MLSGSEEADYLLFCLEKWRSLSQRRGAKLLPLPNKFSALDGPAPAGEAQQTAESEEDAAEETSRRGKGKGSRCGVG